MSYTKEELDEIANISYQHVCERQKGQVFTGGHNENFQGCGLCWCCRPRGKQIHFWCSVETTQVIWSHFIVIYAQSEAWHFYVGLVVPSA